MPALRACVANDGNILGTGDCGNANDVDIYKIIGAHERPGNMRSHEE